LFKRLQRRQLQDARIGLALRADGITIAKLTKLDSELPQLQLLVHEEDGMLTLERLQRLVKQHHLARLPLYCVIPDNDVSLLLVEAPDVDESEMRAAVRWKIKDYVEYSIDDAVIDLCEVPNQRGRQRMLYVAVARLTRIRGFSEILEKSGMRLKVIDIHEMAQRNIASRLPEDQVGVALLQLDARHGMLTLSRQGAIYLARTIDIGSEHIADEGGALASLAAQVAEEDEFVIDEFEPLSEEMMRRLDSIVLEVQRSLDYYESHFALPPVSSLVVAPLLHPSRHLQRYLASNLGLPVRMADLGAIVGLNQPLDEHEQARALLAVGVALRKEDAA
jgi:MSHA biogenesis protein MshI